MDDVERVMVEAEIAELEDELAALREYLEFLDVLAESGGAVL